MPDSFSPTGDTLMVDMVRKFAADRLAPLAAEREKAGRIEPEIVRELGELGPRAVASVFVVVFATFFGTQWLARRMGIGPGLGLLLATGYSICGASASNHRSSPHPYTRCPRQDGREHKGVGVEL